MSTVRLVAKSVALAVLMLLISATPTMAEHAKQANAGDPDAPPHCVDRNSLEVGGDAAAVWGTDRMANTALSGSLSCSGDVEAYDAYYGDTGWYGQTGCESGYNWLTDNCDVFYVKFNMSNTATFTFAKWHALGCHELGHTGGLGHRSASNDSNNDSCMREDIWPRYLDQHDRDAIANSV